MADSGVLWLALVKRSVSLLLLCCILGGAFHAADANARTREPSLRTQLQRICKQAKSAKVRKLACACARTSTARRSSCACRSTALRTRLTRRTRLTSCRVRAVPRPPALPEAPSQPVASADQAPVEVPGPALAASPAPEATPAPVVTPAPTPETSDEPLHVRRVGGVFASPFVVGVAVVDSGLDADHPAFAGRVGEGVDCTGSGGIDDGYGHGTHVAGILVSLNPGVRVHPVRIYDSSGDPTWASVHCGLRWVAENAARLGITAVNLSAAGAYSVAGAGDCSSTDQYIAELCALEDAGVIAVFAAGNDSVDVDDAAIVPARLDDAGIAVSAIVDTDGRPGGQGGGTDDTFYAASNHGAAVALAAPGESIVSAEPGGGFGERSGTSQAAPAVTAAVAAYRAGHPGASLDAVRSALRAAGEAAGTGHNDPSGLHPEPVLDVRGLR